MADSAENVKSSDLGVWSTKNTSCFKRLFWEVIFASSYFVTLNLVNILSYLVRWISIKLKWSTVSKVLSAIPLTYHGVNVWEASKFSSVFLQLIHWQTKCCMVPWNFDKTIILCYQEILNDRKHDLLAIWLRFLSIFVGITRKKTYNETRQ